MAQVFPNIDSKMRKWLAKQHMFFVATAPLAGDGLVNCSPKGLDAFRVLDDHTVAYLDLTGSGVETIAHLKENGRIVLMFCSYDKTPRIVRFHGKGRVLEAGGDEFKAMAQHFPALPAARSVIVIDVQRISDACGFGVPLMDYKAERTTLTDYWGQAGEAKANDYQRKENAKSLDGLPGVAK
jgi:hypothetical protein